MAEGIDIVRVHAQADFVTLNALFDHPAICTSPLFKLTTVVFKPLKVQHHVIQVHAIQRFVTLVISVTGCLGKVYDGIWL